MFLNQFIFKPFIGVHFLYACLCVFYLYYLLFCSILLLFALTVFNRELMILLSPVNYLTHIFAFRVYHLLYESWHWENLTWRWIPRLNVSQREHNISYLYFLFLFCMDGFVIKDNYCLLSHIDFC